MGQLKLRDKKAGRAMAMQLKVIAGTEKDKGRTFDLPDIGSLHLGRSPETDSRLSDVRVSGSHCRVYVEAGRLTITDNGSTNGTFVNERPLAPDELCDLAPGDVIRLGENTRMEVAGDDIAVMKTVAGNAGMLARELAAAAAKLSRPAAPVRPSSPQSPAPRPARAPSTEPTIEVLCSCGQQLVAREKYAGTRVRCPNCRNILQLPGRPALAQPVSEEEVPLPPVAARASGRWWMRLLPFAVGVVLLLATGVGLSVFFGGGERSSRGPYRPDVEQARRSEAP
jgi:predicted component of type VI protein secretion system